VTTVERNDKDGDGSLSRLDKWVLGSLTVISTALIVGAAISDDPGLFLGYLPGPGALAFLYMLFVRN
jgi:hypothetical protein